MTGRATRLPSAVGISDQRRSISVVSLNSRDTQSPRKLSTEHPTALAIAASIARRSSRQSSRVSASIRSHSTTLQNPHPHNTLMIGRIFPRNLQIARGMRQPGIVKMPRAMMGRRFTEVFLMKDLPSERAQSRMRAAVR